MNDDKYVIYKKDDDDDSQVVDFEKQLEALNMSTTESNPKKGLLKDQPEKFRKVKTDIQSAKIKKEVFNKPPHDPKKIANIVICITLGLISFVIIATILLAISSSNANNGAESGIVNQIDKVDFVDKDDNDKEESKDPSITLESTIYTVKTINDNIVTTLENISKDVLKYNAGESTSTELQESLKENKDYIGVAMEFIDENSAELNKYSSEELLSSLVDRFQNAYRLCDEIKPTMTADSLVDTFNSHIEKEAELNEATKTALAQFFIQNDVLYTFEENSFSYSIE